MMKQASLSVGEKQKLKALNVELCKSGTGERTYYHVAREIATASPTDNVCLIMDGASQE
jgi:hypothetical protein